MKLIAVDLHQDSMVYAALDYGRASPEVQSGRLGLEEASFAKFRALLSKNDIVALESTTNAFWFHHRISPLVSSCHVLDMNAVHLRGNKTDKIDARKLLQVLSTFVITNTLSQMPTVYVPTHNVVKLRSLFCTYRQLMKINTQLRNRIHSLFSQCGIVIQRKDLARARYRASLLDSHPVDDYWREQVEVLLDSLETLIPRILRTKRAILALGLELFRPETLLLSSIPGFSPFTAIALMSDIADIRRFPSAKKMCAYLRTAPSIRSSNHTRHLGSVSKAGRPLTVTLLTQSINHLKKASPSFSEFYQRLRSGKSPGKCRIALIRKTLTAAFYMLTRGKEFNHKDPVNFERKHQLMRAFLRDYQAPVLSEASAG